MTGVGRWLARAGVLAMLVVILGWPVTALCLESWKSRMGASGEPGVSLMTPIGGDLTRGEIERPLRLAFETVRIVVATEVLVLPIGLPLAFFLFRTDAWGRNFLKALLVIAAFVPLPLHATAWLGAFGNAGRSQLFGGSAFLVGWSGAAFVQAMAAIPWLVIIVGVGLRTVERELEESAMFDLPAWRVVAQVTFRRALGAVLGGVLAVAVLAASDMTVTDLLQVRTYAEEAYLQYSLGNGPAAAATVTIPPLLVLGGLVGWGALALMKADPARLATVAARAKVWRLGRWRVPLGVLVTAIMGNFVALPLYALCWRAGRVGGIAAAGKAPSWSLKGLGGSLKLAWSDASEPLYTSLALAAVVACLAVMLAWSLAWLCRDSRPWRWIGVGATALAFALPGPVVGMAIVYAYREAPRLDFSVAFRLGVDNQVHEIAQGLKFSLYDSPLMMVIAGLSRTFAYALLIVWPAVRAIPREWLEAGAIDGLGPFGLARKVGISSTRGAIVAAWLVVFMLAFGELPATNLATPPGWNPLSVTIWGLLHTGVESHLAGVVLIMLTVLGGIGAIACLALSRLVSSRP